MKASELIKKLQQALEKYDDLEIYFLNGESELAITGVKQVAAGRGCSPQNITGHHVNKPERLVLMGRDGH